MTTEFSAPGKLEGFAKFLRTIVSNASLMRPRVSVQWGMPTFTLGAIVGVLAGVVVSIVESVGDYHACARLSAAPPPPLHAVNRGIAVEGIGSIIAAVFGAGCGLTSFRYVDILALYCIFDSVR